MIELSGAQSSYLTINKFNRNFRAKTDRVENSIYDIEIVNGVLFCATDAGLITFDGVEWRHLVIRDDKEEFAYLYRIHKSTNQEVYGICSRKVGKFSLDKKGRLKFTQITPRYDKIIIPYSRIETERSLYIFCEDSYITIDKKTGESKRCFVKDFKHIVSAIKYGNNILVGLRNKGFYSLNIQTKALTPLGGKLDIIINKGLEHFFSKDSNNFFFVTKDGKLHHYRRKEDSLSVVKGFNFQIKTYGDLGMVFKDDFLLYYQSTQCILYNYKTRTILFEKKYPTIITEVIFDKVKNLWVSTYGLGIYYEEVRSPLMIGKSDVTRQRLLKTKGGFWAVEGAGNKISYYNIDGKGKQVTFKGFDIFRNLDIVSETVFVSSSQGIYVLSKNGEKRKVFNGNCYKVFPSKEKQTMYISLVGKFVRAKFDGERIKILEQVALKGVVFSLVETEKSELWISGSGFKGVKKLSVGQSGKLIILTYLKKGLDKALYPLKLSKIGNKILINHRDDIQLLDPKSGNINELVSKIKNLPRKNNKPSAFFTNVIQLKDDKFLVLSNNKPTFDEKYKIPAILTKKHKGYNWDNRIFRRLGGYTINSIQKFEQKVLINANEELIEFDSEMSLDFSEKFDCRIRKVTTINEQEEDSVIYWGNKEQATFSEIKYQKNNLVFNFAGFSYEALNKNKYSHHLIGYHKTWSAWSNETKKEYTNLKEGTYIFEVKCKNVYGIESTIARYKFIILPPWYRTAWAFAFYGILTIAFITLIVHLYGRRQKRKRLWLEGEVARKTREINEQKEELWQQSEELKASNEQLTQLGKFKSGVMGMIVHDLKNPAIEIVNGAGSIKDEKLRNTQTSLGMLIYNMVLNILDVDKSDETDFARTLEISKFKIQPVIENAINLVRSKADSKFIRIGYSAALEDVVNADQEVLTRILSNLLLNAVKYSPASTQINISSEEVEGEGNQQRMLRIKVKDAGVGILKEDLGKVFTKYYQGKATGNTAVKSTGLGLTFCKLAVEAHGGTIGVDSIYGAGSTFWFTIPLMAKHHHRKDGESGTFITKTGEEASSLQQARMLVEALQKDANVLEKARELVNKLKNQDIRAGDVTRIHQVTETYKDTEYMALSDWVNYLSSTETYGKDDVYRILIDI